MPNMPMIKPQRGPRVMPQGAAAPEVKVPVATAVSAEGRARMAQMRAGSGTGAMPVGKPMSAARAAAKAQQAVAAGAMKKARAKSIPIKSSAKSSAKPAVRPRVKSLMSGIRNTGPENIGSKMAGGVGEAMGGKKKGYKSGGSVSCKTY